MQTITRKSMLYKTGVEYGDYTMNHVQGCFHGCKYPCYAYLMAKRFGKCKTYEEWIEPKLVENTLELLDKEIPKLKDKINSVQLCFTTDPFMTNYPEVSEMTLKAIEKLNNANIPCNILTKGILPIELSNLSKKNEYGITLVSLDENYRIKTEPNASPYQDRINALKKLHESGCKTWVSIEPFPTPNIIEQNIFEILNAISFVDKIIFGRTHYNKMISEYKNHKQFYNNEAKKVISFCQDNNIAYHIKTGTLTDE
ncbi:MAG: radical SAM protein [Treponema succinifaciens]|uniref:radical SAM protein n=1 Tax=Treponema succinifaciens TaxID=167 RepID=UPI0023539ADB|nr:radical SAM protein [Treponema succinifaciens]MCI6913267.1 radical SAM protein [Treponema succinifaciens]MDY2616275.1 radical SAM protein [Treponema succinifaciens]